MKTQVFQIIYFNISLLILLMFLRKTFHEKNIPQQFIVRYRL